MSKILRLLDWDTRDILAEKARTPVTPNFPLDIDWEDVFKNVKPKDGYQWNLLYDSCDTPDDVPTKEGDNEVYVGYAKSVDLGEYWTQHDNTGRHIDGIRDIKDAEGRKTGWRIYDPALDEKRRKAQEYADALANSPFYYYIKDTGSCQKPNQERVYRIFVDPDDPTKISSDYWGNLGSTPDTIYSSIYLVDVVDKEHMARLTVENGKIRVREQPFYLSTVDFTNCFEPLLIVPLDAKDANSEDLAKTNNGLLDAFKMIYDIAEIQSMRRDVPSKRRYVTIESIRNEFANVLGKQLDPENFTFGELSLMYQHIVQDLANTINNTPRTNPDTSGKKYVSAMDFKAVFAGIVDEKINLKDFTLGEVCQQLNGIVNALNILIEGA